MGLLPLPRGVCFRSMSFLNGVVTTCTELKEIRKETNIFIRCGCILTLIHIRYDEPFCQSGPEAILRNSETDMIIKQYSLSYITVVCRTPREMAVLHYGPIQGVHVYKFFPRGQPESALCKVRFCFYTPARPCSPQLLSPTCLEDVPESPRAERRD